MSKLEDALALALAAHRGQVDKAGQPYILHPLRVMLSLETESEWITGVLHDVVEDSDYTLDDLRSKGFAEEVIGALDCLTRRKEETYEEFIARVRPNPLARRVKLADLRDNMDVTRLAELTDKDHNRLQRYIKAYDELMAVSANPANVA